MRLMFGPVRWLIAALACLVATAGLAAEGSIAVVARPGMDQAQIETLLRAAQGTGRSVTLRWEPAAEAGAAPAALSPDGGRTSLVQAFATGLALRLDGLRHVAPAGATIASAATQRPGTLLAGASILAVAAALAFLLRRFVGPRGAEPGPALADRLRAASGRAARDGLALAGFVLAAWIGAGSVLRGEAEALTVVALVLRYGASVALYAIVGRALLAPGEPGRRLLPLAHAEWHFRLLMVYAVTGAVVEFAAALARLSGAGASVIEGWFLLGSTALTALKLWWFLAGRRDIAALFAGGGGAGPVRRAAAAAWPLVLAAIALLIWAAGLVAAADPARGHWGIAAGATQVVAILLPILALGASELLRGWVPPAPTPLRRAGLAALRVLLAGGLWVCGVTLVARLWVVFLDGEASGAVLANLVRVAASLVVGWTIWTFLRTLFAAHLPAAPGAVPAEDEGERPMPGRLATVLPILRDLSLGAVVAVTALVVLSSLGLDIAPLLAGFGVVGLAISFGSQALVRDIVSGIFFMSDDAFRLGEYVDTGRLKGTVERITLRSVQLRHQNGQIHTIPFGQIQSISNFSRDWATMKFTLRLDRDADLEQARRTIKKVGQRMLDDPALGPDFILPLKMQGVQEIADTAILVRCKFTAKPTNPAFLQREALKRIYHALNEAGIPLASNGLSPREAKPGRELAAPAVTQAATA